MMEPVQSGEGTPAEPYTIARAAGYTFEQVDRFLGKLGKPVGVKSYKPYHSVGEDFLHNYLGMVGVPMDLVPEFPEEEPVIFLAETAKFDENIVSKIKHQLMDGKDVIITSGLLRALQNRGIDQIAELRYTDKKALVRQFQIGWRGTGEADSAILIPQIKYLTNDSWEEVSGVTGASGYPLLHSAGYANGTLYVLTIPENFSDLYRLPPEVLKEIRRVLTKALYIRLEGPSLVSLFVYDNDTFIVESFRPEPVQVRLVVNDRLAKLRDLVTDQTLTGETPPEAPGPWSSEYKGTLIYETTIKPHSYRVFHGE